ncbi:helicase [Actinoplanes sp. NPDC023801]|uniref:helicase n=1 Tax=Actinoplanes sp. NPDC023801 TaxID=3154595 RepID=UPI0033C246D7
MTQSADGRRRRRRLTGAAVPLSILLGSLLVWQSSQAAYSVTTDSANNSWASGSVTNITNTMSGGVQFTVTNIRPDSADTAITYPFSPDNGYTGQTKCVNVQYTGSAARVRMYVSATGGTPGGVLQNDLIIKVDRGTGDGTTDANCTAFSYVADVYNSAGTKAGGVLSGFPGNFNAASGNEWTPAMTTTNVWYRISWLLPSGTANTSSGQNTSAVFTWEAQVG